MFLPRDFAQLIWATATLQKLSEGPALSSAFVAAFLSASGASLPRFKPIDLANTLWGLATLGVQPPRRWLACALAAAARCWSSFQPFELSISVWALAKLGVCFRGQGGSGQQQQQHMRQWQQRSGSSTQSVAPGDSAAAGASAAAVAGWVGGGGNGPAQASLHESGFGWLLGSISLLMPAMGLQEVANLLWGLAVGRAVLSQLQVQVGVAGLCAEGLCVWLSPVWPRGMPEKQHRHSGHICLPPCTAVAVATPPGSPCSLS